MVPWNDGEHIDRWDARYLLGNFIPTPIRKKEVSQKQMIQENQLNYERFRSIIESKRKGLSEQTILLQVQQNTMDSKFTPTQKEVSRLQETEDTKQKDNGISEDTDTEVISRTFK